MNLSCFHSGSLLFLLNKFSLIQLNAKHLISSCRGRGSSDNCPAEDGKGPFPRADLGPFSESQFTELGGSAETQVYEILNYAPQEFPAVPQLEFTSGSNDPESHVCTEI